MRKADFVLDAQLLSNPGVYAWIRGTETLYIGQTANFLRRIGFHEIINGVHPIRNDDKIEIWYCSTPKAAKSLEKELLAITVTKYNTIGRNRYEEATALREQMIKLHKEGWSCRDLAQKFGFGKSTVWKVVTNRGKNVLTLGPNKKARASRQQRAKQQIERQQNYPKPTEESRTEGKGIRTPDRQ